MKLLEVKISITLSLCCLQTNSKPIVNKIAKNPTRDCEDPFVFRFLHRCRGELLSINVQ